MNLRSRLIFFAISLCVSGVFLYKELQIDSFELQVLDRSSSVLIDKFNLIQVNALALEPNTKFHFKCSASGAPIPYVAVKSKNNFTRNDTQNNLNSTSVDYTIETVDCGHSSDYTCQAGSMAGLKQITARIMINCPVSEAKFTSNKKNHYVTVSNLQEDLMLTCEDNDLPNSLTLFNQENRSHRLNYIENTNRVTYTMSSVKCEDMGTYICVVNKSKPQQPGRDAQDLYNVTEVPLDISVNNCPPRFCHKTIEDSTEKLEYKMYLTITICVEVSIGTRVFGVFYNGKWMTNGTCKEGLCLDCKKHDGSPFKHDLKVTFSNVDTKQRSNVMIYIGSGYNYKNNYMNYTIRFKHDVIEPTSQLHISRSTLTLFRATSTPQIYDNFDGTHDTLFTWIRALMWLCLLLFGSTLSLSVVVVYFYKKKTKNVTKCPVTVASSYNTNQQLDLENTYDSMDHSSQTQAEGNFQDHNSISTSENGMAHFYVNCGRPVLETRDSVGHNWIKCCWNSNSSD